MRANYFLRTLAAVLPMCWMTTAVAADFTANSEASFRSALEQAEPGDKIIVSGEIVIGSMITIDKNVTIVSASEDNVDDCFVGDQEKLFLINPPAGEAEILLFKNLGFYDAASLGTVDEFRGGAVRILSGHTEFVGCAISGNYSDTDGGAFNIAGDDTYVKFYDCSISENSCQKRGGAFFIQGGTTTVFEYCQIAKNYTLDDRGGGFFIDNGASVRFFYCLVGSNVSGKSSLNLGQDATPEDIAAAGDGRGGGGICMNGGCTITMDACSISDNTSLRGGSHGSAFFIMGNNGSLTLVNSIVAGNLNRGAGSMFLDTTSDVITLVNTNYVENRAYDNGGNSSTIRVMNIGTQLNIFNSILAGNEITQPGGAVDLCINDIPGIEAGIVIKNSCIGLTTPGGRLPADRLVNCIQDNDRIANKSRINYYNISGSDGSAVDWFALDSDPAIGSGINFRDGRQATRPMRMAYYTLVDANAYAAKLGDAALLADEDITEDFLGTERAVASDGSIAAGPLQGVYGYKANLPDRPIPPYTDLTGISNPRKALASQNIRIIGTVSNGILGVDYGDLKGRAKGELVALDGRVIEKVFDINVIGKGYYNVKTALPGTYILKVTIDGKTYAQRVVVK